MRPKLLSENAQCPTPNAPVVRGWSRFGSWKLEVGSFAKRTFVIALACFATACRQDMHDAPRYEPLEASAFFASGSASRVLVPNTVPRGYLREDELLNTGKVNGEFATTFPMPVTADVMARGQERYNVFCSPCHGRTGAGNGMIVQRGFRQPPSYGEQRLRDAPAGYFYDVIANGNSSTGWPAILPG